VRPVGRQSTDALAFKVGQWPSGGGASQIGKEPDEESLNLGEKQQFYLFARNVPL